MTCGELLLVGGTSDARELCLMLDQAGLAYTLSVASEVGRQLAGPIHGAVRTGKLDAAGLKAWLCANRTRQVIDASHPYAQLVSANLASVCRELAIPLLRWQRPGLIDAIDHPLLLRAASLAQACALAAPLGPRVLLTTGSKDLAHWQRGLPGKTLLARVLPTSGVLAQCEALGLGVGQIFALCPPFSEAFNRAFYEQCQPDVVITKESGKEGGFIEKVRPCLEMKIPCIVLTRPASPLPVGQIITTYGEFADFLATLALPRSHP
ncbi:cobalt-precorrin-6A reductase [Shimwellia blattae]|uniref:Vitamin b12 biosynthetic protein CbiJ n=2 Tax=Shimwellia blattae TaxID=563 RepID=K6WEE2_SHIBC|nr:cobalt-precorrin-6A reductase [Shimwellia blattae]AAW83011.1 vitamin b12 biosynthetic protein [Shimwellia blattae]AFJ46587.1 vitamin b12 biosynthetic protein CbiJ [Shimwellia blattae DSM 4481 = NBRC 105725]VDY64057.1 Precorrin-6A reductase [Shimwellia blattae]VEC22191.1 Precorrin-6A reductase [Shimwellia blattae]GAB80167.1 putative vitamin B12 biosynthetic protein [Shimwellia blattae DSM 4481 = NBRC 105725]